MKKTDYRCMVSVDDSKELKSKIAFINNNVYGQINSVAFSNILQRDSEFKLLEKSFGKITPDNKKKAQEWCDKWEGLVNKYCTHKHNTFEKNGYAMNISVYDSYAYYHIVNLSTGEHIGRGKKLYLAVKGFLYRKKTFLDLFRGEIKPEYLIECSKDAIKDWELITE